jgi:DnaJ-class molecular chaperone
MSPERTPVGDRLPCHSCQGTGFKLARKFGGQPLFCRECVGTGFIERTATPAPPAQSTDGES